MECKGTHRRLRPSRAARPRRRVRAAVLAMALAAAWRVPAAPSAGQIGEVTLFGEEEFTIQAATKTEIPISKAPGSVTVISAQQIRESGARTIPELLRSVAGVNVRWNPMVQTVDMRSFGQNPFTSRVLLLIDGVPYNSWNKGGFPQHPGFDFFVLQNIKRIEVLRGPGSSLYGENAFWGVINIVSLSGEDLEGGKVGFSAGDLLDQSVGAIYGKKVGEGSILVSGRLSRGQLPVLFWFEEADSEVEGSDVFLKGTYKNFEASYYRHDDEVEGFNAPGFIPGTRFRSAEKIAQTVDIFAVKFKHDWDAKGLTFSSDVSYARREGSRCGACHAAPQNPAFEQTVDHGHQLIGDFRLGIRKFANHDLLVGLEARRVDTGDHKDELLSPADTEAEVVFSYTKVAAYLQDQISFLSDRLRLTVGARFDGSNDLFDSELSPRVALTYNPVERLVLRAGWSTAFRFPNFSELYQKSFFLSLENPNSGLVIPIQVFTPNPNLQPEEIRTFDFGVEYRLNAGLSAKIDLYYSEVRDFIVLAYAGARPTRMSFENHPDVAEILGSQLELRWRPAERFTGFVNWSYQEVDQRGDLTASDGRLLEPVYSPKHKVNAGTYFGPFAGFRVALEAEWRDERFGPSFWNLADRSALGVLEDYVYLNARLSWEAPLRIGKAAKGLRFSVYGHNLLDEEVQETFLPIDMTVAGSTYYGTIEVRY